MKFKKEKEKKKLNNTCAPYCINMISYSLKSKKINKHAHGKKSNNTYILLLSHDIL